jgi:proteic killer suppression protein
VIASFKDKGTEDVFDNEDTKAARKTCPREIWKVAQRKLAMIEAAAMITDLRMTPGNALEKLKRDRAGQQSIRINDQYRICFVWTDKGAKDVEITDYH